MVSLRGLKSPYHPTKNGTGGGERSKESGTGGRALEEIRGDGSRATIVFLLCFNMYSGSQLKKILKYPLLIFLNSFK